MTTAAADTFDDLPDWEFATRQNIGILMALWAESGGGKTLTALILARALAALPGEDLTDPAVVAEIDKRIFYIDTDGKRAKHYAVTPGALPSLDPNQPTFAFRHQVFPPPFSPERMAFLIDRGNKLGCKVIVADSFSYVWEGEGGVKDIHDHDAEKAVERRREYWNNDRKPNKKPFDEDKVRGDASHWKNAKSRNRRMNTRMLQSEAHLIFCGHADDKMRMEEKTESFERGGREISFKKVEITPAAQLPVAERWIPICEKKFPRQLVLSLLLTPEAPGVAVPLKISNQHKGLIPLDRPLDLAVGLALRDWSLGATRAELRPHLAPENMRMRGADQLGEADDDEPLGDYEGGDDFPGDRERQRQPATSYDDAPDLPPLHEQARAYAGRTFEPDKPRHIDPAVPIMEGEQGPLKAWAVTLRDMIEHAPDDATRRQWSAENSADLLRLKTRSAALASYALHFMPADAPATESPPGDNSGTVSNGAGADGPADLFQTGTEN